jgi:hypothetical protein
LGTGKVSLDDPSLLHRSTKPPGTGNEITGWSALLLGIAFGRGGRGLLDASLAGRDLSSCRDDRTLILLIRCASMLSELCMMKIESGCESVVCCSVQGKSYLLVSDGTWFYQLDRSAKHTKTLSMNKGTETRLSQTLYGALQVLGFERQVNLACMLKRQDTR